MQDTWLDALDRGEMSAVVMCDMSAAFDLVNHGILLKKLELYGFQDSAISWLKSYLSDRSQRVIVDGSLSDPVGLSVGVPQGSILGPLLYVCYTNDMPECIHDHEVYQIQSLGDDQSERFNLHCHKCGDVCCYADDSTFSKSSDNAFNLMQEVDEKYKNIVEYMISNRLVINTEKTHLLVMFPKNSRFNHENHAITLNTGTEIIYPVHHEKLLGGHVSADFTWKFHIRDSENSLFRTLVSRVNAFSKISNAK